MSFSFRSASKKIAKAINYANGLGIICVALADNDGMDELADPAPLPSVMGVASTTDYDTRCSFQLTGPTSGWHPR